MIFSGHQPQFLPPASYFAKIDACNVFVLSDDVDFVAKEWQNRNRIPDHNGNDLWLTVPVRHNATSIASATVAYTAWGKKMARTLELRYRKFPGWPQLEPMADLLNEAVSTIENPLRLVDLIEPLLHMCAQALGYRLDRYVYATALQAQKQYVPDVTEKLYAQMLELACDAYLSGMSGPDYMQPGFFPSGSLYLFQYTPSQHVPFPQHSVIDLIARFGQDAPEIRGTWSLVPWVLE